MAAINIPHGRFRNRRWGYRLLHTRSGYVVLLNKERKTQSQINKTFSYSLFLFDEYLVCRLQFVAAVGGYHIHSSWEGKSQAVAVQRANVVAFPVNARDRQPVQPVPGNYFTLPFAHNNLDATAGCFFYSGYPNRIDDKPFTSRPP